MNARELAQSMRDMPSKDWREYWLTMLQDPRTDETQRRHAYAALRNLGHPQREPGSDDA